MAATAGRLLASAIMPSVCFLVGRHALGLPGAVGLSLLWGFAYQVLLRRLGRGWSVLVTMNLAEMLLRSVVSLCLNSATTYFVIPSVVTVVFGVIYVISYFVDRPLFGLIAAEILPPAWTEGHPRRASMLRTASVVYGAEQVLVATLSIVLALHLSPSTYVELHPPASWATLGTAGLVFWLACKRRTRLERRSRTSRRAFNDEALRAAAL